MQHFDAPKVSSHFLVTHHPTPQPLSFYLFKDEGKKRDNPFQKMFCNFFLFLIIIIYLFLLNVCVRVCVLYLLTLYKPVRVL